MFSGEVIAQAIASKPGYYAGEEVSAERARFVEESDARQAADWKVDVAWDCAQPLPSPA
ncbi:hypothetical protein DESA109040_14905 [Deinococcus saxicola]|uniref:hypothetical protein n=1 Tax=Deinococcus saxicola TaxID=249406 RepID=UPI0039F07FC3